MAPNYKLVYFNGIGLGESIRYLLHYGNIEFEDVRIEFAEWEQWKPKTNFGKVPMLVIDGKSICQSTAICRYLAKQVGLMGSNDWDNLQADSIVDSLTDLRLNYSALYQEPDEKAKAAKLEAIRKEHNPFYLRKLDKIVSDNAGYFVNGKLSWADIYVVSVSEFLSKVVGEQVLDPYPSLKALKEKVENLPGIKEYRATRPVTEF